MAQTSVKYLQANNPYFEGQYIDTAPRIVDGAVEQIYNATSDIIEFGRVVVMGTSQRQGVLPSTANDVILGVTVLNELKGIPTASYLQDAPKLGYFPKQHLDLITFGDLIVYSQEAVNYNDPVYFTITEGAAPNLVKGRFLKTSSAASRLFPRARFMDKTLTPGLVRVRFSGLM